VKTEQKSNDSILGIAAALVLCLIGYQLLQSNHNSQLAEKNLQIEKLQIELQSFKDGVTYGGN
jgi:hypothetical protein